MYAVTTLFSELLAAAPSREALEAALTAAQVRWRLPEAPGLGEIEGQAVLLRALAPTKPQGLLELALRPTRFRGHLLHTVETPTFLSSDGHVVYKLGGKLWRADEWLVGATLTAAAARQQIVAQLPRAPKELLLEPGAPSKAIALQICVDGRDYACCYASLDAALLEHAELGDRLQAQRMLLTGESFNGLRVYRI